MFSDGQKKTLLKLARDTIENYIKSGTMARISAEDEAFRQKAGAFVTIHKQGQLRGCIGYMKSDQPLQDILIEMAIQASRNDPRFPAVTEDELKDIDIEISVLYPKKKAAS